MRRPLTGLVPHFELVFFLTIDEARRLIDIVRHPAAGTGGYRTSTILFVSTNTLPEIPVALKR